MSLQEELTRDMKEAMKAKDSLRLNCIRQVRTAVKNKEIETRGELDDAAVLSVISTLIKQRREAAEVYRTGGREDLAVKEEDEAKILSAYLPEQLEDDELEALVVAAIAESGAQSPKDMGKVMKVVLPKVQGRADGKRINEMVRAKLA